MPSPAYKRKAVDADFKYGQWTAQTLTRSSDDATTSEEATVYTNIKRATARKLTYGETDSTGGDTTFPTPSATTPIVLAEDEDQDVSMLHEVAETARTFKGINRRSFRYVYVCRRSNLHSNSSCSDAQRRRSNGHHRGTCRWLDI